MFWVLLLVLLIFHTIASSLRYKKFQQIHKQLPINMKYVPIIGHAVNFIGNSKDRMKMIQQSGREAIDHGGNTSLWMGDKFLVVIGDPEAAEVVMKTCLDKSDLNFLAELVGNGTLNAPLSTWRPRRKFVTQIFTQKTLNSFVQIFSKQSGIFAEHLIVNCVDKGNFSMYDEISKYFMDSVCESVFGVEVNSISNPNHPIQKSYKQYGILFGARMVRPWLYSDAIYRWHWNYSQYEATCTFLKRYVYKIVQSKRESMRQENQNLLEGHQSEYDKQETKIKCFLELLIKAGEDQGFTDQEIQEEAIVMLLAGTDTSSSTSSFAALLMAKYPEVQEKVYQEIKDVIGTSERPIEPNDLPKLKYLDAVIKEAARLYPPIPVITRMVKKDVILPSGVTLVPGVRAVLHIWGIHRNPKYWGPDPDVFRPARFLEDPIKHPYAYIPFSNGLRNCVGTQFAMMSMKTVLAHIIRRFRLLPPLQGFRNTEELPTIHEFLLKHEDDYELQIELRNR